MRELVASFRLSELPFNFPAVFNFQLFSLFAVGAAIFLMIAFAFLTNAGAGLQYRLKTLAKDASRAETEFARNQAALSSTAVTITGAPAGRSGITMQDIGSDLHYLRSNPILAEATNHLP